MTIPHLRVPIEQIVSGRALFFQSYGGADLIIGYFFMLCLCAGYFNCIPSVDLDEE